MPRDVYNAARIASIGRTVGEAIDAAAMGEASWDGVTRAFGSAFPGSFAALHNQNFAENTLNFLSVHNIAPESIESYLDYYAFRNPWASLHLATRSGQLIVSERDAPIRSYANTEFCNDWLLPQKDFDCAVGLKLQGDAGETLYFPVHFPLVLRDSYEPGVVRLFGHIRGSLARSIEFGRLVRRKMEDALAGAALVERAACAAFVVGEDLRVRDANQKAVDMFSRASAVSSRHGRARLEDRNADNTFRSTVTALCRRMPIDTSRIYVRNETGTWKVSLAALPTSPEVRHGVLALLPLRTLVLVLVTGIGVRDVARSDLSALSTLYGLSKAEIRMCELLMQGESVSDIADVTGVSNETARTRIRSIFQKTGTHKQGSLVALLARLLL